jgi:5-methyltetrahydrofolate--homocysteine methyltransferase
MNPDLKMKFDEKNRQDQELLRKEYLEKQASLRILPIEGARQRKTPIEWKEYLPPVPSFLGTRVLKSVQLSELVPFIDWSPFFHTWELRGRYPKIFEDAVVGKRAKELFDDAQRLLGEVVEKQRLSAHGVFGFSPANSVGDDVEIYENEEREKVQVIFHFLRQQVEKPAGQFQQSLADFVAPRSTGIRDYLGMFAVTTGVGIEAMIEKFEKDHDDYQSIMIKALADRFAEAFAEYLHHQARLVWGFGKTETLSHDELIREKYQGIRPAPGYPACPDHTEKTLLFEFLQVEKNIGIKLTESMAMMPASSVSGFYFSHPESKYFAVGKIGKDQVIDYHRRKGMEMKILERWLSPNLGYEA